MTKLSDDRVHELHKAAVDAGLTSNRTTLLGGLDVGIRTTLPDESNPSAQLLSDIQTLNDTETADGSVPLLSWLKAVYRLTSGLKQGQVFEEAIKALEGEPEAFVQLTPAQSESTPAHQTTITVNNYGQMVGNAIGPQAHAQARDIVQNQASSSLKTKRVLSVDDPNIGKPPARNRYFEGREKLLEQLHSTLKAEDRAALTQAAIAGLGGIGKTSLAIEYVHRFKDDYSLLWWLRAEDETVLASEFAQLATELHRLDKLPEQVVTFTVPERVNVVQRWLMENEGWLLVFDNAGAPESLEPYLVGEHKGHVIVTSRSPNWDEFVRDVLSVPVMERHESVAFLLKRSGKTDEEAADALADELGDLPLALTQAAAYIKTRRISIAKYLKMFKEKHSRLLAKPGPPRDYPETVATTWSLSFEKVKEESEAAAQLLNLMAFLAPTDIPLFFFQNGIENLPRELGKATQDEEDLLEVAWTLRRYSLIETHEHNEQGSHSESLSVHRLVQTVVRDALEGGEQWVEIVSRVVNESYPSIGYEHWELAKRLLEHAQTVIKWSQDHGTDFDVCSSLLTKTGAYLHSQAQYEQAKSAYSQAFVLDLRHLGPKHPNTLTSMDNLGLTLSAQGNFSEALLLHQKAVEVRTRVLGPEHPGTLTSINNLGLILYEQGDFSEAKELHQKSLEVRTRMLSSEHADTLTSMNNLGLTLHAQGNFSGAKELYQKALEIQTRVLGNEHPSTLALVNNLALALHAQRDFDGARQLQEKTLEVITQVLGPEHPSTLTLMNNLATTLYEQGDFDGAKALQQKTLDVSTRVLGAEHPSTLMSMSNSANTLTAQGDLDGAIRLQKKALEVTTRTLGPEHPHALASMNNLANALTVQGDFDGARQLQEKTLEVTTRTLGSEHPHTFTSMGNLAQTLYEQRDFDEVRKLEEKTVEVKRRTLGEEHPDTLNSISNLAQFLFSQGDLGGARALKEKVLEARRRVLGNEHPSTLMSIGNLTQILKAQGDLDGARVLQEQSLNIQIKLLGQYHESTTISQLSLITILMQLHAPQKDIDALIHKLTWLLQAPNSKLSANQRTIRDMLAQMIGAPNPT